MSAYLSLSQILILRTPSFEVSSQHCPPELLIEELRILVLGEFAPTDFLTSSSASALCWSCVAPVSMLQGYCQTVEWLIFLVFYMAVGQLVNWWIDVLDFVAFAFSL